MPRFRPPRPDDYAPREVADLKLLGLSSKVTIYKYINSGVIRVIYNEFGERRVTREEIARLQRLWKIDPSKLPIDELQAQAAARLARRAGGFRKAAMHTPEEIAEPMTRGRRESIIRKVNPDGRYTGDELERRIELEEKARISLTQRLAVLKQIRDRQYNSDPA